MKKRILISIAMLLAVVCVWAGNNQQKQTSKTIYYVVVGSFEDFNEAVSFNNNGPLDTVFGNIYTTKVNGRTVYRVCTGCFYSKAKAQAEVRSHKAFIRQCWGQDGKAWIWANKGLAKCVERGVGNDGSTFSVAPR